MLTYIQAELLYQTFGVNSVVYECMTPEEIMKDVNEPEGEMGEGGFGGDVRKWADVQFTVNEHHMGFNWNDEKSDEANNRSKKSNEAWQAKIKACVLAVVEQIEQSK